MPKRYIDNLRAEHKSFQCFMDFGQRAQLQQLSEQLLGDMDMQWQANRLGEHLQNMAPQAGWERSYDFRGDQPMGMNEAMQAMQELSGLEELENFMRAVFRVRCGTSVPEGAEITVRERGRWYWIESTDTSSLLIFAMLRDLYDLQVKSEGYPGPVLTLPVGTGR